MRQWLAVVAMFMVAACAQPQDGLSQERAITTPIPALCDYTQAFGTAQHTGLACTEVHGMRVVETIVQDPDVNAEVAAIDFLALHESPPLTSGDYVVIPSRSGYTTIVDRFTDRYHVQVFRWLPSVMAPDAELVPVWRADTDWQPIDGVVGSLGFWTNGYVQQFAPAIAGDSLYMPASNGRLLRLDLKSGAVQAVIHPLAGTAFDGDRQAIVNNALSVDSAGVVYYTVVAFPATRSAQPRGAWLVSVAPDNSVRRVDWDAIASPAVGVPARTDLCEYPFGTSGTPLATGPTSRPPMFPCGAQRPALNAPVAISEDDRRLVVFSYANNAPGAAFLVEVDAETLASVRAADTRGHLRHGCGVRLGVASTPGCATITAGGTTNIGNDPDFNGPVRFRGEDLMISAPTIAPNGDWSVGSYDGGFTGGGGYDARGAGLVFTSDGKLRAVNETFWWQVTPSVLRHPDGSFSYLQDRQRYSRLDLTVASYSPEMVLESAGTIPLDPTANAPEFLDAHIVFGPGGDHYAVSAQGRLVKFDASGAAVDAIELTNPDGSRRSVETTSGYFARDRAGHIYASYAGSVYVVASSERAEQPPTLTVPSAQLLASSRAKRAAMAETPLPLPPN